MTTDYDPIAEQYKRSKLQLWRTHIESFSLIGLELHSASFSEVRWHAPRLSPEGESAFGREFWASFLDHSPIAFIECVK
jgi:hypothetical protein